MSHENKGENLYITIHRMLALEQYAEAEQMLEEHLSRDPLSREAILSWTELKLVQEQSSKALERLGPLTIRFPRDPYYMLASAEIVLQETYLTPTGVTELLDGVAACAGDSADVFAKIGFAAAMRGCWSYGMRFFIKAMKVKERVKTTGSQDLIFLWKKNEASLDDYLRSLVRLDGRGLEDGESLDDVPLELLVRTVCILFIATTEAGILEAWPVAVRVGCNHRELSEAWHKQNVVPLLSRFCSQWIGIETIAGGKLGPWSAN